MLHTKTHTSSIIDLLEIMRMLRDPDTGCPWDVKQDFASIAPYTIEEAYEVADAIARGDRVGLRDELGDLLLQVVFHAQMADEKGFFAFDDVVRAICEKMTRRHPHVFMDDPGTNAAMPESVRETWEDIKDQERAAKPSQNKSILDDIPHALPALTRAVKLQTRAARVGFDWPSTDQVIDKLNEEMRELSAELVEEENAERVLEEFGDLLFVYANLARHLNVDPEQALRRTNDKFVRRFNYIEDKLKTMAKSPQDSSLEEMDHLWNEAKKHEAT